SPKASGGLRMKLSSAVVIVLLSTPARLQAAEGPAPPTHAPATQVAVTEVTIDRKDQFAAGAGFGSPIGFHATLALLHGLGADVQEEGERVKAVCAAPLARCARGFLLEAGAGSGGGRLSLGL